MNTTPSFALPEPMHSYIGERVKSGAYGNTSEHLRDQTCRDQEELAMKRLREPMGKGLNCGPARAMTRADWAGLRKAALGRRG